MESRFKYYLNLAWTLFVSIWSKFKKNPIRIIFDLVIVISAFVTIIGFFCLLPQAGLINEQLREINAQPLIKINFHLATSTILFGPTVSEPINIVLVAINNGKKVASYWRSSLMFCKDITVVMDNKIWNKVEKNHYQMESNEVIPPHFDGKMIFYSDTLDAIGEFNIIVPNKGDFDQSIPIAEVVITGDYPNPAKYLVSLSPRKGITYDNLLSKDGRIIRGYGPIIKSCFDIVDPENLLR